MIPINRTFAPVQALVDELARCGLRHAVTCPGSRNAPIALSLADHRAITSVSVLDERSAGFVALGLAKASGRPVAITTTSGTASANLLPAVVEAYEARVPLVVLTADRPPELRDVGAGQAIDQIKLFGSFAKWFVEVGNHEPGRETAVHFRALGCRAYATAVGGRPGPVHLNLPLREPLAPLPEDGLDPADWEGRPAGQPWLRVASEPPMAVRAFRSIVEQVRSAPRGVLVCGGGGEPVAAAAAAFAGAAGWPILADPLSGVRCGPHDRAGVIAHYDVLLRADEWASAHVPDLVLRVGDTPTSKPLRAWLARAPQIVVDPTASWNEPTRAAGTFVEAAPRLLLESVAGELAGARTDEAWLREWRAADALVPEALAGAPADLVEPAVCAELVRSLPGGATVWVSSSMPVRDLETFAPSSDKPLRFLANRGANGIDGVVSSALGAALTGSAPVVLLIGELALAHDASGLLAVARAGGPLGIVCLNNSGGGIFDFLPVAEHAQDELYERHIATPIPVDIEALAALAGMRHALAADAADAAAQAGPGVLVELRGDRAANVRGHRELFRQVAERLGG